MKNVIIAVFLSGILFGCNQGNIEPTSNAGTHISVYKKAREVNDDRTAIAALNYVLVNDTNNLEFTDSLARLYIRNGLFDAGLPLAERVMKKQPDNYVTLELIAEAQGTSGNMYEAKRNFNKLYKANKNVQYLYKLAIIESEDQDLSAFDKRLDQILADPTTADVDFPTAQGMQKVDMKAAVNFLKAQLYYNQGNMNAAIDYVKRSLTISPNFQSALIALEQIKEAKTGSGQQQKKLTKKQLEQLRYQEYLRQQQGR